MVKKRAVKKRKEVTVEEYDCPICQDRKVIERNGKMQRCICVIQANINDYLSSFNFSKKKVNKNTNIQNLDRNMLFFENVPYETFVHRAKSFMFKKFFDGEPFYALISVTDYTNMYVIGETADYDYADYLFLSVGRDNYNQSQLTTISTLLQSRLENSLKTWVYIYPNTPKSKLVEFYGKDFYSMLFEDKEFKRITK